jgi:hypothetical protein
MQAQRIDLRIGRLRKAFGKRVFTTHQAADVLKRSVAGTWALLFRDPGLADEASRVAMHDGDWWIVSRNPEEALAARVAEQYSRILRGQEDWSADEFAKAAGIPYPTANYLLSLMVRFGKAQAILGGDRFLPPPTVIKRHR